jgi:uncharacterized membrane protein
MKKGRLEAFSDGVIAIIITVMVLELRVPHQPGFAALRPLVPQVLSYLLSFVFVGIYWNNHHHLLQAARKVSGGVLWANLHLLFWLSLIPVTTSWLGAFPSDSSAAALYGIVLLGAAIAYFVLVRAIVATEGRESLLVPIIGRDRKGTFSLALYASSIAAAFVHPWLAEGVFVAVALIWLVPDRRIEKALVDHREA